jgi:5-bromo-4-chloroindolyl phosphate hydrolysis protein
MDLGDQYSSAVMLGVVLAVGLILFFTVVLLGRAVWRWITGSGKQSRQEQKQELRHEGAQQINPIGLSAADLFVIRSNLNAVARQIEDLERRLRLEQPHTVRELASTRD